MQVRLAEFVHSELFTLSILYTHIHTHTRPVIYNIVIMLPF